MKINAKNEPGGLGLISGDGKPGRCGQGRVDDAFR